MQKLCQKFPSFANFSLSSSQILNVETAPKRKRHSLHDFYDGPPHEFSWSMKVKDIVNAHTLDGETANASDSDDSDVVVIGEVFSFSSNEELPDHNDDSDVEIIGETYYLSSGNEFNSVCGSKKKLKNDKIKVVVEYGNNSGIEGRSGLNHHFDQSKGSSSAGVNKPNPKNCDQNFIARAAHETGDMLIKPFNFCDGGMKNKVQESDSSCTMADERSQRTDLINQNLIRDCSRKKKKHLKSTSTSGKEECRDFHKKAKENTIHTVNGVAKVRVNTRDCDNSSVEDCRVVLGENKYLRFELVDDSKSEANTQSLLVNESVEEIVRKENTSPESTTCNAATQNKRNSDYSDCTESEASTCEQSVVDEQSQTFKHLAERNHDCAFRRLNLLFPSCCAVQPFMCYTRHQQPERSSLTECMCEYHFLEGEWDEALEVLEQFISKTVCPNWKIIVYLLAYMCETSDIGNLNTCCEIFSSLVFFHPPCYMTNYYLKIFVQAVEMHSLKKGGVSKDGLFKDVLFNLQQHIKLNNYSEDVSDSDESLTSKCNIESLCLVMDLMVTVLEENLSVWFPRRGFSPTAALLCDENCPLIVRLLWRHSKHDGLQRFKETLVFKPIIDLYVSSCTQDVPPKIKDIASRLLALVAEVMRACDFERNATYPRIGQHCRNFANTLCVCVADRNHSEIVKVVQGLSPSWLGMFVCFYCLSRFITNSEIPQNLTFVTNCMKAAEQQTKQRSLPRVNAKGETKLHVACRSKRLEKLELLLSDPTVDVNGIDNAGWTPLHEAVFKDRVENVEKLIIYRPPGTVGGVDLRAPGCEGATPLMIAAELGYTSMCKLLLKYGGASLLKDRQEDDKTAQDLAESSDIRALLDQYSTGCGPELSQTVMFKCAPTQEFWSLLSLFSYSYMDTFMLKDFLCLRASGCSTLSPESRDGKAQLVVDADRFRTDTEVLEKLMQFLIAHKLNSPVWRKTVEELQNNYKIMEQLRKCKKY